MKTKKILFPILMALAISFASCEEVIDEACNSEDLAEDFGCPADIDAVATFCSDGITNSYYTYGGNKYECTGVDASTCDAAINAIGIELIELGCSAKKSGNVKLSSMAEDLLQEVREKSLCN